MAHFNRNYAAFFTQSLFRYFQELNTSKGSETLTWLSGHVKMFYTDKINANKFDFEIFRCEDIFSS